MRIKLVYHRIPHHSQYSGYDQITRHLARLVPVEHIEGFLPESVPPERWEPVVGRAGLAWYDQWSLGLEHAVAQDLATAEDTIYHVLYGENVFRYLSSLRWLADLYGNRFVATYHQPPATFAQVTGQPDMLQSLDAVVAVSANQAQHFTSLVGAEKVFTIPHGIDTEFYRPAEPPPMRDEVVCLCVGQWLRDFRMLRQVTERVKVANRAVTFRLIVRPEDAAAFEDQQNVVVTSGLSDAALRQAYQGADLLVLPLTDCTASNAILEALACGLPIVTTAVGGMGDFVDEECAVMVGAGDAGAMSDAVLRLAGDWPLRQEMGRQSRDRALHFDWGTVAEQMLRLYERLLAQAQG